MALLYRTLQTHSLVCVKVGEEVGNLRAVFLADKHIDDVAFDEMSIKLH